MSTPPQQIKYQFNAEVGQAGDITNNYNAPVITNYSSTTGPKLWISQVLPSSLNPTTFNNSVNALYSSICNYATIEFADSIFNKIAAADRYEAKREILSSGIISLLRVRTNRSTKFPNKRGIFPKLKSNYYNQIKDNNNNNNNNTNTNKLLPIQPQSVPPQQSAAAIVQNHKNKYQSFPSLVDYDESDVDDEDDINEIKQQSIPKPKHRMGEFNEFKLHPNLQKIINEITLKPTETEYSVLPYGIIGCDIIVETQSSTMLSFILSTLQQIQPQPEVIDTLVLCHTREMASQIFSEFERFSKYMSDIVIGCVYGGIPYLASKRVIEIEKPHILIGTPGRVCHLLESGILILNRLKRFIVDECDNILGQIDIRKQVQDIFKRTPHSKQVMMFSATIGDSSKQVCRKFTKNAQEIFVDDQQLTLHGLQQHYVKLTEREKNQKLNTLLNSLDFNQVVIFVKTKARAKELNQQLSQCAFPSICVDNDMGQTEKLRLFRAFKEYKYRILIISTDLFGRGVDIERVNVVINYDMVKNSDEYLCRVGRAVTFGTKGLAITFVSTADEQQIMTKIQERFNVKVTPLPNEIQISDYM